MARCPQPSRRRRARRARSPGAGKGRLTVEQAKSGGVRIGVPEGARIASAGATGMWNEWFNPVSTTATQSSSAACRQSNVTSMPSPARLQSSRMGASDVVAEIIAAC